MTDQSVGEDVHLMAQKGRYGRLGVFVTHFGVVVILLGGLLTFALGFKGQMQIEEGETVAKVQDRRRNTWREFDFQVRCDKFQATFYPDGTPKEYRSDLSFLKDGKVAMQGPLRVNHPLRFEGFSFFQSSYGTSSTVTLEASNSKEGLPRRLQMELGETSRLDDRGDLHIRPLRYEANFEGEGPAVLVAILRPGIHPLGGWLKKDGPTLSIFGLTLRFVEAKERLWTGLQVKKDPGVIPVWVGCVLVLVGCFMAFFFLHRRIWVRIGPSQGRLLCVVAASAPKAKNLLSERMEELCLELEEAGDIRPLKGEP